MKLKYRRRRTSATPNRPPAGLHGCCDSGKRSFFTRPAAKLAGKAVKHARGQRMRVYRCPACGWWHMTSQLDPRR